MARNSSQQTTLSPIVAAMLAGSNKRSLVDRVTDVVADTVNESTDVAGRLVAAFDGDRFSDGMNVQRLRNLRRREERWLAVQREMGLSDADVAAIIAS